MINVRCVQDGHIDMSKSKAANRDLATGKWKHFQVDAGDILFTISGTIGRSAIVKPADLPLLMNTSVVRFRPTTPELSTRFLYYAVRTKEFINRLKSNSTGTAIKNVGPTHIKKLDISFPPLPEQERIVAILDEAFEAIDTAIANTEKNLVNARELFESYTDRIFRSPIPGSEQMTLKEATDLITCGVAKRPEYVENGVPFLSAKNVKKGRVIWRDHKFVSDETHRSLTKHNKPQIGDILYTRVGSFGEAAIVDQDTEFSIFVSLTLIKPKSFLRNSYLKHYLNSPLIKRLAKNNISGSGVGNLNVGTVRKFPIYIPPLPTQDKIAEQIDAISGYANRIEATQRHKLNDLLDLKQSILQKAFSGELTASAEPMLREAGL